MVFTASILPARKVKALCHGTDVAVDEAVTSFKGARCAEARKSKIIPELDRAASMLSPASIAMFVHRDVCLLLLRASDGIWADRGSIEEISMAVLLPRTRCLGLRGSIKRSHPEGRVR